MTFDHFFKRFKRWNLLHKIAVICFFTFGLTLFSCTPGSREVMGEADARRDPAQTHNTTVPVDTPITMGQPVVPPDTAKKHPVKKAPDAIKEPVHMIQGDVMIDPEPVIHTKGEVYMTTDDQQRPVKCAPGDTLKEAEPGKIMGKIKLNP